MQCFIFIRKVNLFSNRPWAKHKWEWAKKSGDRWQWAADEWE